MGGIIIDLPLGRRTEKNVDSKLLVAPEVVADYVHSVLDSDRTVYARHIVNRLEERGILHSKEKWENEKALMLPAQFLLNSAEAIENKRLGLHFRLISLYPINPQNRPASEKGFCTGRCDGRDSGEFSDQIKPKSSLKRQQQK